MNEAYKPDGYNSVSPYLIVDGASDTIEFLEAVFGATELRKFPDADGRLMHAEVRIDDTVVMLADGVDDWPPVPSFVHVYVSDVDAVYRKALEAGGGIGSGTEREGRRRQAGRSERPGRDDLVDCHESGVATGSPASWDRGHEVARFEDASSHDCRLARRGEV